MTNVDLALMITLFLFSTFLIAGFIFYHVYWGVNDNLANATVGDVYNFRYCQPLTGTYERYLAKVVDVRKLNKYQISKLNWASNYRVHDKSFQRTTTLITCLMNNGEYRQFYAERSDMCKRPALAKLLFNMGVAHLF